MKDIQEKIIRFCFEEAMQDATNRVYSRSENFDKGKESAFKKILIFVEEEKKQNSYEGDFIKLCEEIRSDMNGNISYNESDYKKEDFTFGKAQKLINMTFKYLATSIYFDENENIRKNFELCYCPIDSIIAKKLVQIKYEIDKNKGYFNEKGELLISQLPTEEKNSIKDNIWKKIVNISKSQNDTWSKLNKDDYFLIQEEIYNICKEKKIYPIEFDFMNWEKKYI